MTDIELAFSETGLESALGQHTRQTFQRMVMATPTGPSVEVMLSLCIRVHGLAEDCLFRSQNIVEKGHPGVETYHICYFHNHPPGEPCPTGPHTLLTIWYGPIQCNVPDMVHPVAGERRPVLTATVPASSVSTPNVAA
jgi:hypothetical protein